MEPSGHCALLLEDAALLLGAKIRRRLESTLKRRSILREHGAIENKNGREAYFL
jgi:hypothetical protein